MILQNLYSIIYLIILFKIIFLLFIYIISFELFFFFINNLILIIYINELLLYRNIRIIFIFDFYSLMFLLTVFMVVYNVFEFINIYIYKYLNFIMFFFFTLLFIFSIVLLICSLNIFTIIFGWEGLGFRSFYLIFFYNNNDRWKRRIKTFLNNKIGDSILIISIIYLFLNNDRLNYLIFFFLLSFFTKRAQYPFISWLPIAISAPTPISAIVHRSTLVTAGLFIMFRLFNLFFSILNFHLFIDLCLLSIIVRGLKAILEKDMKKIIALSTLSQIGLIIFIILINFKVLAFIYICNHAFFKSLLFINIGVIIIINFSNQFSFNIICLNVNTLFNLSFKISCFNLINLSFFSSFFLKEIFINQLFLSFYNLISFFIFFLSRFFTINYSLKLLIFRFKSNFKVKISLYLNLFNFFSFFLINLLSLVYSKFISFFILYDSYVNIIIYFIYLIIILFNVYILNINYNFIVLLIYLNFLIYIFPFKALKFDYDYVELWIEKFSLNLISFISNRFYLKFININFKISLLILLIIFVY